jgi:hypothetical protein
VVLSSLKLMRHLRPTTSANPCFQSKGWALCLASIASQLHTMLCCGGAVGCAAPNGAPSQSSSEKHGSAMVTPATTQGGAIALRVVLDEVLPVLVHAASNTEAPACQAGLSMSPTDLCGTQQRCQPACPDSATSLNRPGAVPDTPPHDVSTTGGRECSLPAAVEPGSGATGSPASRSGVAADEESSSGDATEGDSCGLTPTAQTPARGTPSSALSGNATEDDSNSPITCSPTEDCSEATVSPGSTGDVVHSASSTPSPSQACTPQALSPDAASHGMIVGDGSATSSTSPASVQQFASDNISTPECHRMQPSAGMEAGGSQLDAPFPQLHSAPLMVPTVEAAATPPRFSIPPDSMLLLVGSSARILRHCIQAAGTSEEAHSILCTRHEDSRTSDACADVQWSHTAMPSAMRQGHNDLTEAVHVVLDRAHELVTGACWQGATPILVDQALYDTSTVSGSGEAMRCSRMYEVITYTSGWRLLNAHLTFYNDACNTLCAWSRWWVDDVCLVLTLTPT